jgi:hypothetical protein
MIFTPYFKGVATDGYEPLLAFSHHLSKEYSATFEPLNNGYIKTISYDICMAATWPGL